MHMNVFFLFFFLICLQYDVVLKKSYQMDLDMAPLKVRKKINNRYVRNCQSQFTYMCFFFLIQTQAKLSCLVMKCQERNNLLAEMMKAMRRHGCADFTLTQQAEQLLRDHALQEYSDAFTPDKKSQGCSDDFGPESLSKFHFYPKSITRDVASEPLEEHASVPAMQAPVPPDLNEHVDTTQVRNMNMSITVKGF